MLSHISYSSLSMALRCGEQFRRRYMLGQIIPPAVAMGMGRGLHKAAEINFKQKVWTKEDLPESDLLDAARDAYIHTFDDGVYIAPDEQGNKDDMINEGLNKTVTVTKLHSDQVAPTIQPVAVEKKFEVDTGSGLPLLGYIDCVSDQGEIAEFKSTSRSWPKNKAETDLQPVFYSIGFNALWPDKPDPVTRFYIHVALKTKPKVQIQGHKVTKRQKTALMPRVDVVINMAQKGVFPPANPGDWVCSPKWCGYYQTCKYVGNGDQSRWV